MADTTIDVLTELTTIANDDNFAVFDASAAALKRISRSNLLANVFLTNVAQSVTAATTFSGEIILNRASATIASDTITAVGNYMIIDTEAAAAADNLATINGGSTGQMLILQTTSSSRDVTVKHGTGNIFLAGGVDFVLDNLRCFLVLMYVGTEWREMSHAHNHA